MVRYTWKSLVPTPTRCGRFYWRKARQHLHWRTLGSPPQVCHPPQSLPPLTEPSVGPLWRTRGDLFCVYGDKLRAAVKFQLKFKYRLRGFGTGKPPTRCAPCNLDTRNVRFGISTTIPVRFTTPATCLRLFFESYTPASAGDTGGLTWLGPPDWFPNTGRMVGPPRPHAV